MTTLSIHPTTWLRRHARILGAVIAIAIIAIAFVVIHKMLVGIHPHDVAKAIHQISAQQLQIAVVFMAASYGLLTVYDMIALRVAGRPLPYRTVGIASFLSYALSHNLGLATVTGGGVRLRIYGQSGLTVGDVARVQANLGISFSLGLGFLCGLSLLFHQGSLLVATWRISESLSHGLGGTLLTALLIFMLLAWRFPHPHLLGWRLNLPAPQQTLAQMLVAATELSCAAATLYILLPADSAIAFPAFVAAYGLAIAVSVVSHAPGGLGVFEAMMLTGIPHGDRAELAGALVAFRTVYYLLPLLLAVVLAAGREGWRLRHPIGRAVAEFQSISHALAPSLISALVFAGGVVLLISAALPAEHYRLALLGTILPLAFVEASHLASMLAGTALMFLAAGLYRRLDGAFIAVRAWLVAGMLFSLIKGIDYEEAIALGVIMLVLQWTRKAFYRRTALTSDIFSPGWLVACSGGVLVSLTIGLFAYQHVDYSPGLLMDFALHGNAARFLRGELAAAGFSAALIVRQLLAPPRQVHADRSLSAEVIAAALGQVERSDAMLAFTGDKRFIVSDNQQAFLAYGVQGHSWVAMGNPVGCAEDWPDLMWDFRARADAEQGRAIFYQITTECLPIAIDMGLSIIKYGEEARIRLDRFTLEGPQAKSLRYALRRGEAAGARVLILKPPYDAETFARLKAVSDEWLATRGRHEKAFSLGWFDVDYLNRCDCAVVVEGGEITAFANLWAMPNREELSVDLMRHRTALSYSAMDLLFTRLILRGKEAGYRWFSLGIAPLSGLDARRLAPLWAHAGNLIFTRGERLYGFEGLRFYKDKFAPEWMPRFIAASGDFALARGLVDLNMLISGARRPTDLGEQLPRRLYLPSGLA